jgi:hypothetical protein
LIKSVNTRKNQRTDSYDKKITQNKPSWARDEKCKKNYGILLLGAILYFLDNPLKGPLINYFVAKNDLDTRGYSQ